MFVLKFPWGRTTTVAVLVSYLCIPLSGQDAPQTADIESATQSPSPPDVADGEVTSSESGAAVRREASPANGSSHRLIYVPFRELQKVFESQFSSVVVSYAEYLDLLKRATAQVTGPPVSPGALLISTRWKVAVEKDVARMTVELRLNVPEPDSWAMLPLDFGGAAVGSVAPLDGSTLLKGVGPGQYELFVRGAGEKTVTLELLTGIQTSPEGRSFAVQCPPAGMSELVVSIPEPDQAVRITPLQVMLPADDLAVAGQTVVRANPGATSRFEVHWSPRAGSKPVMDLLTSVANETTVRIESGLQQTRTVLNYEVLRGELRDLQILVPQHARIIDVVAVAGRIRSWTAEPVGETHQVIKVELLVPATDRFQLEIQTEASSDSDTLRLLGRSENGQLHGVHADGVIREAGRLTVITDPALTALVTEQSGVKQVDSVSPQEPGVAASNSWEFSGQTGRLAVKIKPVEPRLLAVHNLQYVFRDDELRVRSVVSYTVERAGVFQLQLSIPEGLTVDSVSADGMSEFHVDKASGRITLSLTQQRLGAIEVTIQAHRTFDAAAAGVEQELPLITPDGVERETGTVTVYAPEFLDVITVDEKLVGLFPNPGESLESLPRLRPIGSWNFTRRPLSLFVRTSPRPAQIAASVATTVRVEPEVVRQSAVVTWDIRNAGIDTLKISVPESVAADVRFQALSPGHVIQQRDRAAAENGWVPWTLILQNETTGTVQIGVDWDVPLTSTATVAAPGAAAPAVQSAGQLLTIEPPRVLAPFTNEQADRRRVTLTQTRGEIRLLRHESLSIDAESRSDVTEAVDVRELELLEQDGYLAYRYFAQPASATIRIRKHEIHEVAATVVSRAAIEIVTERQRLATTRAQFRITTSERQRLRIDLPERADLQAPLLNDQRTTMERAADVRADDGWEAYYINISRPGTSDQEFLLTLQFRSAIVDESDRPYSGRGRDQRLRLPRLGDDTGSTVVQQMQVAVWVPDDLVLLGNPDLWTQEGAVLPPVMQPFRSVSSTAAAVKMREWVAEGFPVSRDFPTQGVVSVYRAVGRQSEIQISWWSRPFLFWVISGTVVAVGLILRRTSWENRVTFVLLAALVVALFSVRPSNTVPQLLAMAWPGVFVAGGIWISGLLLGQKSRTGNGSVPGTPLMSETPGSPPATVSPPSSAASEASSSGSSSDASGGVQ